MKKHVESLSMRLKIGIMLLLFTNAMSVFADDGSDLIDLWLGASWGVGILDEKSVTHQGGAYSRDFSGKLEIGYDINRYFGLYGSYDYLDGPSPSHLSIGSVGVMGRGELTDKVSLFAKAGISHLFRGDNDNGPIGSLGLGGEYQLTHSVSLKVGVDFFNKLEITRNTVGDFTQIYGGITYRFAPPPTPLQPSSPPELDKALHCEEVKEKVIVEKVIFTSENERVLFAHNSSVLVFSKPLESILTKLRNDAELQLHIVGYTDNTGSEEYNLWLSARRARSVANFFRSQGIEESRLSIEGRGVSDPIASNDHDLGRSQNRRVELTISRSQ